MWPTQTGKQITNKKPFKFKLILWVFLLLHAVFPLRSFDGGGGGGGGDSTLSPCSLHKHHNTKTQNPIYTVADNFGVSVYAIFLFFLTILWSMVWQHGESACCYIQFEDWLQGNTSLRMVLLKTWAQLVSKEHSTVLRIKLKFLKLIKSLLF